MSAATIQVPLARRSVNPWLIAFSVVIPTFMEVLGVEGDNVGVEPRRVHQVSFGEFTIGAG